MADTLTQPRRRWRVVLVISLALNVLVLGVILGAVLRGGPGAPPYATRLALGPVAEALDRPDRRAVAERLRDMRDLPRIDRAERQRIAEDLREILKAESFDATAFAETLERIDARARAMQTAGRQALIDQLALMSQAERAAFAERLERALRRRGGN